MAELNGKPFRFVGIWKGGITVFQYSISSGVKGDKLVELREDFLKVCLFEVPRHHSDTFWLGRLSAVSVQALGCIYTPMKSTAQNSQGI